MFEEGGGGSILARGFLQIPRNAFRLREQGKKGKKGGRRKVEKGDFGELRGSRERRMTMVS